MKSLAEVVGHLRVSWCHTRQRQADSSRFHFASPLDVKEQAGSTVLATESHDALKLVYAQDMFSAFMWSMAKTMAPIEADAEIRLDDTSDSYDMQFFTLWNERLAKMVQDIQTAGLGSLDQIYLSIIPPLSVQQRLPRTEAIVDLVRRQARPLEKLHRWVEAGEVYLWLLRTARSFPEESSFATSAIAVFMEYLRTVSLNHEFREAQRDEDDPKTQELGNLKSCLERELEPVGRGVWSRFMRVYEIRKRDWRCVPVQQARCGWVESTVWPEKTQLFGRKEIHGFSPRSDYLDPHNVDAKDIHNWTPLHGAVSNEDIHRIEKFVDGNDAQK